MHISKWLPKVRSSFLTLSYHSILIRMSSSSSLSSSESGGERREKRRKRKRKIEKDFSLSEESSLSDGDLRPRVVLKKKKRKKGKGEDDSRSSLAKKKKKHSKSSRRHDKDRHKKSKKKKSKADKSKLDQSDTVQPSGPPVPSAPPPPPIDTAPLITTPPPLKRGYGPMTQVDYVKQQSIVRRVVDPETGRSRLVKGDGEIIEEIVSRDRHKTINKLATQGDGLSFQTGLKKL